MPYGDVIRVLDSGPIIRSKALEPLGIYNDSVCWGMWVHNRNDTASRAHLLLSPIHPSSWQFMFRLRLDLKHQPGTMETAARVLSERRVNILFAEGAPAGYRHAVWNVIGEARGVREEIETWRDQLGNRDVDTDAMTAFLMLRFLRDLKEAIKDENTRLGQGGFLNESLSEYRYLASYTEAELSQELPTQSSEIAALWKFHRGQAVSAIKAQLPSNLTFLWRCRKEDGPGFLSFRYDSSSYLLKSDPKDDFADKAEIYLGNRSLPTNAVASFNTTQLYIRLDLLPNKSAHPLVFFDIAYKATPRNRPRSRPASSEGLLAKTAAELTDSNLEANMIRVSNKITDAKIQYERGYLTYIASTKSIDKEHLEQIKERLESSSPDGIEVTATVAPFTTSRVYISMRYNGKRKRDIERAIKQGAHAAGIEDIQWTRTHTRNVSDEVLKDVKSCHGMLCVVTDEESREWLAAEWGMGMACGLVRSRIVAEEVSDDLPIEKELDPIRFPLDGDSKVIEDRFREAFEHLAADLWLAELETKG